MPVTAINAASGRFLPAMTITKNTTAGQFIIGSYVANNAYVLTGTYTSRSGNIVSLTNVASQGTVQVGPPKQVPLSTAINIARTPYTYYGHNVSTPYCQSHYHDGQCAQGVSHNTWAGPYLNAAPPSYSSSEGEWWRIW
jgi:hypothetical protein